MSDAATLREVKLCACGNGHPVFARGVCSRCYGDAWRRHHASGTGKPLKYVKASKREEEPAANWEKELSAAEFDIRRYRQLQSQVVGVGQRLYWRREIELAQERIEKIKRERDGQ